MNNDLKCCPFCGGEAKLQTESWTNPNGHEWGSGRTTYVRCSRCKAQGGHVSIDNFNMFSKHTVQDFRENNLLRAVEDERYKNYVIEQQATALQLWSNRNYDEQRTALRDAFAQALTSVYVCGRVWEAWQYGTMSEGDFQPASECDEVLDSLIEAAHGIKEKNT